MGAPHKGAPARRRRPRDERRSDTRRDGRLLRRRRRGQHQGRDESSIAITPCRRSHNNNQTDQPESLQQQYYPSPTGGYAAQITLATWRKDGFVCLEAPEDGYFATTPFVFTGGRLKLNGWSRYRGGINVELADSTNESHSFAETVSGRGFDDCDEISGSDVGRTVTWNGESDLSQWEGKLVRLRFKMRRARLYSLWFE